MYARNNKCISQIMNSPQLWENEQNAAVSQHVTKVKKRSAKNMRKVTLSMVRNSTKHVHESYFHCWEKQKKGWPKYSQEQNNIKYNIVWNQNEMGEIWYIKKKNVH